jgi:2,4-dienoyl-CoA reductase-like NADH-dependent reductase (Old Yellow Enzyme family)
VSKLFESTRIKDLVLPNRFVRSATWEGLAGEDGSVTPGLIDMMSRLARGGVGLIISGHAYVSREGQAGPWQLGVHSDVLIDGLTKMADAVHAEGGRIALQLAHAGSASLINGLDLMAPSATAGQTKTSQSAAREMTNNDIEAVTDAFARAASRARTAGFDAVQIHAAHGYLLSRFLSPFFNKRNDEYGGNIGNRARLPVKVLKAIRRAVGPDFPVLIKLNSEDFLPEGLTVEDMLETVRMLEAAGIDAIELSGGTFYSGKKNPVRQGKPDPGEPEAYYEAAARRAKEKVGPPIILVGGIRSFETAEKLVADGVTDFIALCRPLVCEPDLVNRWQSGDRRPSACASDNRCTESIFAGKGIACVVKARKSKNGESQS